MIWPLHPHPPKSGPEAVDGGLPPPGVTLIFFATSGFLTWLVWAFVHILPLPQLQNRLHVQRQWLWSYFTGQRSSRLIPEPPTI